MIVNCECKNYSNFDIVTTKCVQNLCNGGDCQYHAGSYICTCLSGLTGVFCEENSEHKLILSICYHYQ